MTPFPRLKQKPNSIRRGSHTLTFSVIVQNVDFRTFFKKMMGCDAADKHCKIWQHLNCASRTGRELDDWFCSPHRDI
jgi:hypothetical protein